MWKEYIQYQKPQGIMLTALLLPLLGGIYNFGWRAALVVFVSMLMCWGTEYAFTRKDGKPASMAGLVTGMLLGLVLPATVPLWMVIVGAVFCIVFGKMAFGGFGKNIFNPAMVGRCFLYISFPAAIAASWVVPFSGGTAGFSHYIARTPTKSVEESAYQIDSVTSATTLQGSKRLNKDAVQATNDKNPAAVDRARNALESISLQRLFFGNTNGCIGETSSLLILLALAYLLYKKTVKIALVIGPLLGMIGCKIVLVLLGLDVMPFWHSLGISLLGGGTMFAITFMTTEPVTAPLHNTARWIYAILIGVFAMLIRNLSIFPAGLMFSILLANMFGPIIEITCQHWDVWKKTREPQAAVSEEG